MDPIPAFSEPQLRRVWHATQEWEAFKLTLAQQQQRPQPPVGAGIPPSLFVRLTSATPDDGRYPGVLLTYDEASDTWSDSDAVWVVESTGGTLVEDINYVARRMGYAGDPERVVFVVDNGSGIDGSGTTNFFPLWADSDTLTDSSMYENGTGVFCPAPLFNVPTGSILVVGGAVTGSSRTALTNNNLQAIGAADNTFTRLQMPTGAGGYCNLTVSNAGTLIDACYTVTKADASNKVGVWGTTANGDEVSGGLITSIGGGGSGIADGDYGDITVSSSGTVITIDNDAVTYAKMQNVSATDRLLGRDTAGSGDVEELTVGGGVEFTGSGGIQRSALTGDVTATAGSGSTTIANDAVSNAKLANMAAWTVKVRNAGTTGDPSDAALADLTEEATPAAGDFLFGFLASGELRTFDIDNLPGGMAIGDPVTSGTAGSVLFVDASGDLGQDNAALFWDITNDRLGVGTDAPATRLHANIADAATNTIVYPHRVSHATSNTAANGFGVGQQYEIENGAGTAQVVATTRAQWIGASTNRTSFTVQTMVSGSLADTLVFNDGALGIYNASGFQGIFGVSGNSADRTYTMQNASGTVAFTSDVSAAVSDTAYDATSWNGVTTIAPSKNAVRDKIDAMISDTAYNATSWNGVVDVAPSKNAVRDEFELRQPLDATLTAFAGLTITAQSLVYGTGADAFAVLAASSTAGYHLQSNGTGTTMAWVAVREFLTATRTYYVRTDGNDSNTGLVNNAGGAFLTINKAVAVIASLDTNTQTVNIQLGNTGTYAGCTINGFFFRSPGGTINIIGDTAAAGSYVISSVIDCSNDCRVNIKGVDLTVSGGIGILSSFGAVVTVTDATIFGACSIHLYAQYDGQIAVLTNYTIDGAAAVHWYVKFGGTITANSITITVSGTPAFSIAFALAETNGKMEVNNNTFSGSATGTRYTASNGGGIFVGGGGATYLPGNVGGTATSPGWYA